MKIGFSIVVVPLILSTWSAAAVEAYAFQEPQLVVEHSDSVTLRMIDVDLRLAVQALGRYLDRPIVFGTLGEYRITLETATPLPRSAVPDLLRAMLETYGLTLAAEEGFYRVAGSDVVPESVVGPDGGPIQLFVLRIRHARAEDVSATVNALYGRASAFGEIGTTRPSLSESLRGDLIPPLQEGVPAAVPAVIDRVAELTGDVTIVPDLRTNSLLVRASREDFELVQAAVQELDVRPLQVLIEVVIAEVRRDRSLGIGLDATLPPQQVGGGDTQVSGSSAGLGLGDLVVRVLNLGGIDLNAALALASSRGDVSILSRPTVLAANNELAEIMVGSQRPFIQVQRALPTDAPVRDQIVQFKDVGTRLSVLPTVSEDGYVMLEVAQEVNAATTEVAFDAPVISTRSIRTQLLVKDGHTAILGGLTDQQRDQTKSGIPILSSIPLIGGLFGRQVERTTETELFLFLTPRVLRTDEDLEEASSSAGRETRELRERWIPPPEGGH